MFGDKLGCKYLLIKLIECTIQSCTDRYLPFHPGKKMPFFCFITYMHFFHYKRVVTVFL